MNNILYKLNIGAKIQKESTHIEYLNENEMIKDLCNLRLYAIEMSTRKKNGETLG